MGRRAHSRGLAASAVAALAVSGLSLAVPSGTAHAAGPGAVLISIFNQGHDTSTRFDGSDTAITLTAQRLDPAATVTFEYNADPAAGDTSSGWTPVTGTPTVTGDFVRQSWTPAAGLVGTQVAVRAAADAGGAKSWSTRHAVPVTDPTTGPASVSFTDGNLSTPDPGQQGFFDQPYASTGRTGTHAAVAAYTSATSGTGRLSWWRASDQTFQGTVTGQVEEHTLKSCTSSSCEVPGGVFYGDLDLTAFDAEAGDVVAVGAELDTDDVLPKTLYTQQISRVTAGSGEPRRGEPAPVAVWAFDASNRPIAGAEIRRLSDGGLVGYTGGDGSVRTSMYGGQVETFYANATDDDGYDSALDQATGEFTPYGQSVDGFTVVSVDGPAFDDDEYAAGDLRLQVVDQYGVAMAATGQDVDYRLYPTGTTPPAYTTATSDAQGRVSVPFSPAGPDGGYTLDFHRPSGADQTFTFTAGDSALTFAPAAGASSPGGQIGFIASLEVAGQPMPGRRVSVSHVSGVELVPGRGADATLVDATGKAVSSLTLITDAQGHATFVVDDPAEQPQGAEVGGTVRATTVAASGEAVTGDPHESATATTAFGSQRGTSAIALRGRGGGKDRLVVSGDPSLAGERVVLYRLKGKKKRVRVATATLDSAGRATVKVRDRNGRLRTTYLAVLLPSDRALGSTSRKVRVR